MQFVPFFARWTFSSSGSSDGGASLSGAFDQDCVFPRCVAAPAATPEGVSPAESEAVPAGDLCVSEEGPDAIADQECVVLDVLEEEVLRIGGSPLGTGGSTAPLLLSEFDEREGPPPRSEPPGLGNEDESDDGYSVVSVELEEALSQASTAPEGEGLPVALLPGTPHEPSLMLASSMSYRSELALVDAVTHSVLRGDGLVDLNLVLQKSQRELGLSWKTVNAACRRMGLCLSTRRLLGGDLSWSLRAWPQNRVPRAVLRDPRLRAVRRAFCVRVRSRAYTVVEGGGGDWRVGYAWPGNEYSDSTL